MIFCRENRDGEFLDLKMSAGNQGGTKSVFSCNALNLQSSAEQWSAVQCSAVFPTSFIHQEIFITISFTILFFGCSFLGSVGIDTNTGDWSLLLKRLQLNFSFLLECFVKMLRNTDSTEPFLDIKYLDIYSIRPGLYFVWKSLSEALFCLLFLR